MSRTWRTRPEWVKANDPRSEEMLDCHNCGAQFRYTKGVGWRYVTVPCTIDKPVTRNDILHHRCYRYTLKDKHYYRNNPSWWVREMETRPDRQRVRLSLIEAGKMYRENPASIDDFDEGPYRVPCAPYW